MNSYHPFDNSPCEDQVRMAERELASFIGAVKESFGPEQALRSAEDWLDECELTDRAPRSTRRDWRAITVVASAIGRSCDGGTRSSNARGIDEDDPIAGPKIQLCRIRSSGVTRIVAAKATERSLTDAF